MKTDDKALIRKRAYELWERAGRPEGDGLKHWFEAAAEIQSTKINGGQQDVAVVAQPNEPAVVAKVKRAPKSTTVKQSESTKPLKKTIAPKKSGGKKGKRPEAQ